MSDARAPLARVRLLDGRELVIEPDAARVGERVYLMSRIQEARLLFLQPETIGLRMADIGLVEYSVARPGDGQVALEAIYRARPDLRRADAAAPAPFAPPGYHATPPAAPPPPWPAPPQQDGPAGVFPAPPPGVYVYPGAQPWPAPPRATPFPPQVMGAYGPEPERRYATLSPTPRRAGQLAGATFRLVALRFGPLLALAALVVLLPYVALGGLAIAVSVISGQNPWAGEPNPLTPLAAASAQATPDLAQALSLLALVAGLALAGWTVATLTVAARDVALGRPLAVFARAREGAQRLWPVISTLIITDIILLVIAIPGLGVALGMILVVLQPPVGTPPIPAGGAVAIIALAVCLALATLAALAWVWPRVALAPTAAALGLPAPFRTAWGLAQGGAWRILGALVLVGIVTTALTIPAALSQFWSSGLASLLIIPLAQLISAPLTALVRTLALYDQRLRREGYALFQQEGVIPPAPVGVAATDQAAEPR